MSELETNFNEAVEKINLKLKEAAAALREANRLSEEVGLPALIYTQFISENYKYHHRDVSRDELRALSEIWSEQLQKIDVSELEGEMSDAGWNPSSSYC